jgi:hypothetical protein
VLVHLLDLNVRHVLLLSIVPQSKDRVQVYKLLVP